MIVFLMDFIFGVHNMSASSAWHGLLGYIYKFLGQ
jgi:hypothetical protein